MAITDADRALLVKHLPQLRYHVLERFRADSAATLTDSFVPARHSNTLRRSWPQRLLAQAAPSPRVPRLGLGFLVPESEPYPGGEAVAERGDYVAAHGPTLEADSRRMHAREGLGHVIYCRIAPGSAGRRWLQYWLFFYDNPFKVAVFGRHQGDWEMVQVGLGGDGLPFAVTYAQHERGARRDWADVPRVGDRPVVYLARGSHASYFAAGRQRREDLPFGIGDDYTSDGVAPVAHTPHFLDPAIDRWLLWPGSWGGSRQLLGESPPGPWFQTKWRAPERFHGQAAPTSAADDAGLAAEDDAPLPMEPLIVATLADGAVVVGWSFAPAPPAGETEPVRIEVAVHGAAGLPVVTAYPVAALAGEARQPVPAGPGPYTVHVGVYDAEDRERLLPVVDVVALGDGGAALDDGEAVVLPVPVVAAPPSRPLVHAEPLRLVVRAPEDDPQPEVTLALAVAAQPGPAGRWGSSPLFAPDPSAPELARWFSLTGAVVPQPGLDVAALAFQAARELELPAGWTVQPDVPTSVVAVDPPEDEAEAAALDQGDPPLAWALDAIRAEAAWGLAPATGGRARGEGILIGQPDTGFTDHPELGGDALHLLLDHDVLTGADDAHAVLAGFPPLQFPSHGTGTASVAVSREAAQVTGSAPRARVVPIRAAETVVHVRNAELALAVDYARRAGCHVVTISMGGIAYPGALRAAIRQAVAEGVIVMAAAGQPLRMVVAPASYPECLAVAGTRPDDEPWGMSARGPQVDWCAPAKAVWVAAATNDPGPEQFHVAPHSGTSFAVALSAGVAALWLAHHGRDAVVDAFGAPGVQGAFLAAVRRTARRPAGWDEGRWGAGIIDAEALLGVPLAELEPVVAPAADAAPPRWRWALDRAAELTEGVATADAEERVRGLFGGDEALLATHGEELVHRLAEHAEVRDEVLGGPGEGAALADGGGPTGALAAVASPALRAALA